MGALSVGTGLGWSWVLNLSTPGTVRSWVAPGHRGGHLPHRHRPSGRDRGAAAHHPVGDPGARGASSPSASGCGCCCDRTASGALRAMGLTMLIIVALGPGGPALVPVVGARRARPGGDGQGPDPHHRARRSCRPSSGCPAAGSWCRACFQADPLTVAVALLVCLAILTVPLSPFDRERLLARWRRRGDGGPGPAPRSPRRARPRPTSRV